MSRHPEKFVENGPTEINLFRPLQGLAQKRTCRLILGAVPVDCINQKIGINETTHGAIFSSMRSHRRPRSAGSTTGRPMENAGREILGVRRRGNIRLSPSLMND